MATSGPKADPTEIFLKLYPSKQTSDITVNQQVRVKKHGELGKVRTINVLFLVLFVLGVKVRKRNLGVSEPTNVSKIEAQAVFLPQVLRASV